VINVSYQEGHYEFNYFKILKSKFKKDILYFMGKEIVLLFINNKILKFKVFKIISPI